MSSPAIAALRHPNDLREIVGEDAPAVVTSASVAQVYGLPGNRVREGGRIDADWHHADYHELHAQEPALLLEDLASFCTLLCAADEHGNATMLHAPLLVEQNRLTATSAAILAEYRRRTDALLQGRSTVVGCGLRTPWAPVIAAHIATLFAGTRDVIMQLRHNGMNTNAVRYECPLEHYSGMLFIPAMLARSKRQMLLLLDERRRTDTGPHL